MMQVVLAEIEQLSATVKKFTLTALENGSLPQFSAGSHILLKFNIDRQVVKNPYSLLSISADQRSYSIAVKLETTGRGGSKYLHTQAKCGDQYYITHPINNFPIYKPAKKHILIAGGIGITPFVAYLRDLSFLPASWELHYCVRNKKDLIFAENLQDKLKQTLFIYCSDEKSKIDLASLLDEPCVDTHVYVCGSENLVAATANIMREKGWSKKNLHCEIFLPMQTGKPFHIKLVKSNQIIQVSAEETMLEALERNNINIPYSCRNGACGTCMTEVLDGKIEHRDFYLSGVQKEQHVMPCISRARSDIITLNL